MIYRVHINSPEDIQGEKWFARQIDGQYAHLADQPLPDDLASLLKQISDASERPSS